MLILRIFLGLLEDFWVPQRAAAGPRSEGPILGINLVADGELFFGTYRKADLPFRENLDN